METVRLLNPQICDPYGYKAPNGLNIVYEDASLLVCVKPAGIACETKKVNQQDMVSLLRNYRSQKGEGAYIALIHRLDQPVEGLLVFGKNPKSAAALSRQLAQGDFTKVYLALTQGKMPAPEGRLENYLKKDSRANRSLVVDAKEKNAKTAILNYQVLEKDFAQKPGQNLVRIELQTGRHHQIRVQMAHLGTPVVGDRKYGVMASSPDNDRKYGVMASRPDSDRKYSAVASSPDDGLKLCACELSFVHPEKKTKLSFQITPSWAKNYHMETETPDT